MLLSSQTVQSEVPVLNSRFEIADSRRTPLHSTRSEYGPSNLGPPGAGIGRFLRSLWISLDNVLC